MAYKAIRDIERLSDKELKKIVQQINKEANAQIELLREENVLNYSFAYSNTLKSEGRRKFTVKRGADRAELISEYQQARMFLSSPTSTVEGVRKSYAEFKKETEGGEKLQYRRYIRYYPKIVAALESVGVIIDSKDIPYLIDISMNSKSTKEAFEKVDKYYKKIDKNTPTISDKFYEI